MLPPCAANSRRALCPLHDDVRCYHSIVDDWYVPLNAQTSNNAFQQNLFICSIYRLLTHPSGSIAERINWNSFIILIVVWEVLVYYPLAHWIVRFGIFQVSIFSSTSVLPQISDVVRGGNGSLIQVWQKNYPEPVWPSHFTSSSTCPSILSIPLF